MKMHFSYAYFVTDYTPTEMESMALDPSGKFTFKLFT